MTSKDTTSTRHGNLVFGSCTNVGKVRDHNEDSLIVDAPLFAVADGMGGHAAGEVASEIAVQVLRGKAPRTADAHGLAAAIEAANHEVIKAAQDGRGREGMGTTMTAAVVKDRRLIIGQVGDSRAYLLSQGVLQQLTRDHSLMADMIEAGQITPEEARVHPKRSVITRALGSSIYTQPDLYELNVQSGDRLLLCSDGLSSVASRSAIEHALATIADPQQCAEQLVEEAIRAGGFDNITVIVIDIRGSGREQHAKHRTSSRRLVITIVAIFILLLAGVGFGLHHWVTNAAFLADNNGKVAIYQGVKGTFLGMEFNELKRTTSVDTDALSPGVASRLKGEGIKVDTLEQAEELAASYEEEVSLRKQSITSASNAASGTASVAGALKGQNATNSADAAGKSGNTGSSSGGSSSANADSAKKDAAS